MVRVSETSVGRQTGYWYPEDASTRRGVELLGAMRGYRNAEMAMRRRTRGAMGMGETDLIAVQYLIREQRAGRTVSAKDLAQHLAISSASTTVLIDRLVRSKHVERRPHPTDRRGVVVVATDASDREVRSTLATMHQRMLAAADQTSEAEAEAILSFLNRMREAVDSVDAEESEETVEAI
ncbi:MarR family transcriptional regulator [Microbacteriaceae bacterium VKM Ac-2855]|nr:MarR family transcriptional regulator [Microbacteriaceae bacterium VKM Ac-2855]